MTFYVQMITYPWRHFFLFFFLRGTQRILKIAVDALKEWVLNTKEIHSILLTERPGFVLILFLFFVSSHLCCLYFSLFNTERNKKNYTQFHPNEVVLFFWKHMRILLFLCFGAGMLKLFLSVLTSLRIIFAGQNASRYW